MNRKIQRELLINSKYKYTTTMVSGMCFHIWKGIKIQTHMKSKWMTTEGRGMGRRVEEKKRKG